VPYFDYNATTPLSSQAREAWLQAADEAWQNPSSAHRAGTRVRLRMQMAREKIAALMGCEQERVVFTSGATESMHAIVGHLAHTLPTDCRIALAPFEHPCVIGAVKAHFPSERVHWLPVTSDGVVSLAAIDETLASGDIGVVLLMAANNETGVLQLWEDAAARCRAASVPLVCDASQWLGKVTASGLSAADWLVMTAHKFGAPKGVAFLLRPQAENGFVVRGGGSQESGQRAGTEDYPAIASMAAALAEVEMTKVLHESQRERLRDQFEHELTQALSGVRVLGAGTERLWNTSSLILPHGESQRWVMLLDRKGFEVSVGAACSSGSGTPSPVLAAMGVPAADSRRVIRISAGWDTTAEDWAALREAIVAVAAETWPDDNVISPPA
jgi:cysteine desulfurase